ncbi:MAG: hypothetical protein P8179_19200 [Candidatus Thiodiazotropha sp.]|jgi:hypothetical protein
MQYYILDGLGEDKKFCHVDSSVEGFNDYDLVLDDGGTLKGVYPKDPYEVIMHLDEDYPKNIVKGDLVCTTDDYVMVSERVVEELKKHNIQEAEFWPFTLMNHKGRVHSKDYRFVVTPQFDALHDELSDIKRSANGVAVRLRKIVLDKKKLENAPDMFRVNDLGIMAFSGLLVKILQKKFTNFVFNEVEQA